LENFGQSGWASPPPPSHSLAPAGWFALGRKPPAPLPHTKKTESEGGGRRWEGGRKPSKNESFILKDLKKE